MSQFCLWVWFIFNYRSYYALAPFIGDDFNLLPILLFITLIVFEFFVVLAHIISSDFWTDVNHLGDLACTNWRIKMVYVMSWSLAWLDEPFTRVWDLGAKISSRDKHFAMAWFCREVENHNVTISVVLILAFVFLCLLFVPFSDSDNVLTQATESSESASICKNFSNNP